MPKQPPGDTIETNVGEEAQNVAAGKNIVQIIIDKLMLPSWFVYTLIACFLAVVVFVVWFVVKATFGGIPVALAPTAAPALTPHLHACPDDHRCVLVADFSPTDDELAAEITRKIRTALASEELLSTTRFTVAPVDAVTSASSARQRANEEQALIIVWGEIFRSFKEVNINFALTDQFGVGESHQVRPYRVHVFDSLAQRVVCEEVCFEDLTHVEQVLDQVSTTIAYTAAGMLYYANDQPEAADRHFVSALVCSGYPVYLTPGRTEEAPTGQVTATSPVTAAPATALPDTLNCAADQPIVGLNPASIYYYAGKVKILTGDYAAAIAYLQAAAQHNPEDPAAWVGIATAYASWLNQDNAALVEDALEEARQRTNTLRTEMVTRQALSQEMAAVDYELGLIAELAGTPNDLKAAQAKYTQAVDSFGQDNPDAYVPLIALGRAQRLASQTDAAEATLGKAIKLDNQAPWAYLELAQVYHDDRTKAKRQLDMARKVVPDQAYVDIIEGTLCASADWQDFDCAEAAYTRALEKRPNSGWLQSVLGDFYRSQQNWNQAVIHYEQAAALRPNDPWAHDRLAYVYFTLGRYAQSAQEYARSLNELSHPQTRTPERYCVLAQAQQAAQLLLAALANFHTCLDGLEEADERRAQVEQWIADIEAAQQQDSE